MKKKRSTKFLAQDKLVGAAIRKRREEMNMSLKDLAKGVRLTFQQVQKYETGASAISVSRLLQIADALGCAYTDLIPTPPVRGR